MGLLFLFILLAGCIRVTSDAAPAVPTQLATAVPLPTITLPPAPHTATPIPTVLPPTQPLPTAPPAPTLPPSPATTLPPTPAANGFITQTIGLSVEKRPLISYTFGNGPTQIVFIGGIHGGYEWNTILLAYDAIDYFTENPNMIPISVTLHIIPSANPDGQFVVTGKDGRFSRADVAWDTLPGRVNGNQVDLNRNWGCNWSATAVWRDQPIGAGSKPFSEPENVALRNFIVALQPTAVVFWHSAFNGVFAAGCPDLYQPSYDLAFVYSQAAGYPVYTSFDTYPVTGDAGDWLATQGIPAVSVELTNHESLDWNQNLAGMLAVLNQ